MLSTQFVVLYEPCKRKSKRFGDKVEGIANVIEQEQN